MHSVRDPAGGAHDGAEQRLSVACMCAFAEHAQRGARLLAACLDGCTEQAHKRRNGARLEASALVGRAVAAERGQSGHTISL